MVKLVELGTIALKAGIQALQSAAATDRLSSGGFHSIAHAIGRLLLLELHSSEL